MEAYFYEDLFQWLVKTYFGQSVLHLSSQVTFWFSEVENYVNVTEQQKMDALVLYNSHFFR